jgi:tRNA(Ile)-lysidine synthase
MQQFLRNLITEWRRLDLPLSEAAVVFAVSGGADSTALLLAADELKKAGKLDIRIVAAHFEHGLRGESGRADLEFVRKLTTGRGIELAVGHWKHKTAGNLEQEARRARYDFLTQTAAQIGAKLIVTAHTMNDQAETFLLNLIRGSGPDGLGGISPRSQIALPGSGDKDPLLPFETRSIILARPLLCWATRRMTEDFCAVSESGFCTDPMNEDLNFRRVWIRKVLLPMLSEANPKIVETLCRTAETLRSHDTREADVLIDHPELTGAETIRIADLRELDSARLRNVIRQWLRNRRGGLRRIGFRHIAAVERLIKGGGSGRKVELPGGEVIKSGGRIRWHPKTPSEKG